VGLENRLSRDDQYLNHAKELAAMLLRSGAGLLAALVLFGWLNCPAGAQHGQDPVPSASSAPPSGANPTAQAVTEEQLLQEMQKLEGRVSIPDYKAALLEQPQGRGYQFFHEGLLPWLMGVLIVAMVAGLALFFLLRGRIVTDAPQTGIKIRRFNVLERATHWMTATCFIVLALTGLNYVFGKRLLFPLIGPDAFAAFAQWSKLAHTATAWPFMLGLLLMAALWVRGNLPDRHDWRWLREFGGFTSGTHPPAGRFNAGQKLIFWSVVIFGLVLSATGIIMMFPFWTLDINGMQLAQYGHASAASILITIIIAHIYIGTLGMAGAYDAMGNGEVDLTWAREHHSLWAEEQQPRVRGRDDVAGTAGAPAE
jgi:formate dehydrogenase subunit gamma